MADTTTTSLPTGTTGWAPCASVAASAPLPWQSSRPRRSTYGSAQPHARG